MSSTVLILGFIAAAAALVPTSDFSQDAGMLQIPPLSEVAGSENAR
jgi:hypothetical protein